jgi:hypothetical protein
MAFMHGPCWKNTYEAHDFWLRVSLFDELAEHYKKPEALGFCRGRKDRPSDSNVIVEQRMTEYNLSLENRLERFKHHEATFADEAVLAWEPFKFAIVFQNTHEPGAVQEKIVHAWLARAVPVYFGPSEALTDYNPESFINCEFTDLDSKLEQIGTLRRKLEEKLKIEGNLPPGNHQFEEDTPEFKQNVKLTRQLFSSDFQKCLQKIKAVDQDEEAWARMVHAPVFKGNSIQGSVFDVETYAPRFREVLRAASSAAIP